MSTGCHQAKKTDQQTDRMPVWQNSRAAKEPALVLTETFPPLPLLTSKSIVTYSHVFHVRIEYVFISYLLDDQIIYHICHKNTEFFMFRLNMSWQVIFLIKWFITFVTRITNVSWTDSNGLFNCVPICFVHVWQNWELQYAYLIETFHPLPLLTSSSIATWFSESCTLPLLT